jgi:hypothetical protein
MLFKNRDDVVANVNAMTSKPDKNNHAKAFPTILEISTNMTPKSRGTALIQPISLSPMTYTHRVQPPTYLWTYALEMRFMPEQGG